MPSRAARPCTKPGCPRLVRGRGSRCEEHGKHLERPTSAEQGYDAAWRKLRARFLIALPFCADCEKIGLARDADEVDHVTAHRGDHALRLDWNNLRSLCHSC